MRLEFSMKDNTNLGDIIKNLGIRARNMKPAMEEVGDYMVRSTKNRIYQTNTSPDGTPWDELRDSTVDIKGNDRILVETGALARSITAEAGNREIAIKASAPYARYMQEGVRRTGGYIRNATIPPRPFLGFSQENRRRITEIVANYLLRGKNG